eukprot:TRINITY_DN22858_c0_g1_i2.p1 TRINITY_DN22858_c0_g1~~TRINITY_DN22858_c0_g1_i2.p1  ORF type:complete len:667 (+),score=258.71 TRINITY_DN22858_c0_g1_i2:37-2001(+)
MASIGPGASIEDRLTRHEDVLRSYKEKFEEHKKWLQGQRDLPSFVTRDTGAAWDEVSLPSDDETFEHQPRRSVPVHDSLLERGKLYEQKREAAREEAIKKELKQLRSKPKISKQGASKVYEKPIEERFMELEARRKKDLDVAKSGRLEDAPQYPFKPQINRKGKQAATRTNSCGAVDQWKQRRDQKLEEARKRQLVEVMAMQRAPEINEHSRRLVERKMREDSGLGKGPHYTHADSLLERDRLAKLQLWEKYQQELAEQQPGNPKITPFAASMHREGSVSDRLYEHSVDQYERKNYLLMKKYAAEGTECYHSPRITMNAALIRREQPVHEDLLDRHETAKVRKEEAMKQIMDRERHLHRPAINPVSDEIASRLCQTARERLYQPKTDYSALQEQYSYQPDRPVSEARVARRASSLGAMRGKDKKRREELRDQQDKKEMEQCTFKPKITRPPLDQKGLDFLDRTAQRMRKKEDKLREARRERDTKEVQECPFAPNIGYKHDVDEDTHQIYGGDGKAWGFDDFVERQRQARKLNHDKERGQWVTGKNWKNEVTVPKEFSLGRKDQPVRSLQKPLSPPRASDDDTYDDEDDTHDQDHGHDYPEGAHPLPQAGLFSEGATNILQPREQQAPYDYGYSDGSGAPMQAWAAPYPSWGQSA